MVPKGTIQLYIINHKKSSKNLLYLIFFKKVQGISFKTLTFCCYCVNIVLISKERVKAMELFSRRPLCLFCCLFLLFSAVAVELSPKTVIIIAISVLSGALLVCLLSFLLRGAHVPLTTAWLCLLVSGLALLQSFFFVGLPQAKAEKYTGNRLVHCYVVDKEYTSSQEESYYVKLKSIDGSSESIKATVVSSFRLNLDAGDEIYGLAYLSDNVDKYDISKGRLLTAYMEDSTKCYVRHTSEGMKWYSFLTADSGIEILSNKLTDNLRNLLTEQLGDRHGALAMGFFTGDREVMPADITRDFRRSGVSHLMAVSGSHIAILLGGMDLLLRKLSVDKKYRCITVALFGVAFLFVAGFSLSAVRSVFMLYSVYLAFFFYGDNDSLTSLFVSVALIVLIAPFSIADLGLLMSFLATLGLLTVYPVFEGKLPYPKKRKSKLLRNTLILLRRALLLMLMTVVANAFLLPVMWLYFGELSLVSILTNLLITPMSTAFMLTVPIFVLLCKLPLVGYVLRLAVSIIAEGIIRLVNTCLRLPYATVSLKYTFCTVIILLFTVSMLVLLCVRLKHKMLIGLPLGVAVIAFTVCFLVNSLCFSKPTVTYIGSNSDDLAVVSEGSQLAVCDISSGGYYPYLSMLLELKASNATELQSLTLTHYHSGHSRTVQMLSKQTVIRQLYLPTPQSEEEQIYAKEIWHTATENGTKVSFYKSGERIKLTNNVVSDVYFGDTHKKGSIVTFVSPKATAAYTSGEYNSYSIDSKEVFEGYHFSAKGAAVRRTVSLT